MTNANTIEIRIFKANLKRKSIIRNIEFVHAVFTYCKDAGATNLEYENFVNWIYTGSNGQQYHYFKQWLEYKGYAPKRTKRKAA